MRAHEKIARIRGRRDRDTTREAARRRDQAEKRRGDVPASERRIEMWIVARTCVGARVSVARSSFSDNVVIPISRIRRLFSSIRTSRARSKSFILSPRPTRALSECEDPTRVEGVPRDGAAKNILLYR